MAWDTEEEFLGEMLTSGAAKGIFRDEEGELLISWDLPMLRALYPEVYDLMEQVHHEEVADTLNSMVKDGLLEVEPIITPDGELDEQYNLTDLGKEILGQLDPDQ
jgi:DNA-binding HxlR family transcriptional regulator